MHACWPNSNVSCPLAASFLHIQIACTSSSSSCTKYDFNTLQAWRRRLWRSWSSGVVLVVSVLLFVDVRNPPAGSDGQHSRAGNNLGLRLALVPPSDGPQSLWYTRPMLVQGRATWPIPGQEGNGDASLSFLHGIHVNIKYEPRSALRLSCESAQGADPPMIRTRCTNIWWSCLIKIKLKRSTTI